MPQFVLLAHTLPGWHGRRPDHWDLLFDLPGPGLRSWRLPEPLPAPGWRVAEPLPPHRRVYLLREGATRAGNGWVQRTARGVFRLFADGAEEFRAALACPEFVGMIEIVRDAGVWRRRFVRG